MARKAAVAKEEVKGVPLSVSPNPILDGGFMRRHEMTRNGKKGKEADNGAAKVNIAIQPLDVRVLKLTLVGDTPLIVNRFTEKVMKEIEDKVSGTTGNATKKPKDINAHFENAKYKTRDGKDGIPAGGIKNAMLSACRSTNKAVKQTELVQQVHILGDILPLRGSKAFLKTDPGRNPTTRKGCVIHRPCYEKWEVDVDVRYNASVISPSLIVNLLNLAGFGVGLCEWRPEKRGTFGTFHVLDSSKSKSKGATA